MPTTFDPQHSIVESVAMAHAKASPTAISVNEPVDGAPAGAIPQHLIAFASVIPHV